MAIGRPKEYKEEYVKMTSEYLEQCQDEEEEFHATRGEKTDSYQRVVRVRIPTIEGLAVVLGIHKDTIYEWCKTYEDFSDVIEILRQTQADRLLNNGLSGNYNPTIAKVLLTKHGYREAIDTDNRHVIESLTAEDKAKMDVILGNK